MTRLQELYTQQGQSPWIDNLNRPSIEGGGLQGLVDSGMRGITSNPTIFQKAMTGSDAYDEQFKTLIARDSVEAAFWDMATDDVIHACGILRPVYDRFYDQALASQAAQHLDMVLEGWAEDFPDPTSIITPNFASGGSNNVNGFSSASVDRRIAQAAALPIESQARARAWASLADDLSRRYVPIAVVGDVDWAGYHSNRVQNLVLSPPKFVDLALLRLTN